ncbi:methionine ABC transporter permease [Pimelobacter sp. 30-1]|uniref:methionine ABC transporter permease n=1 Tax=Pimelobacter sp. 30-1 TaxID=2004991 RepID=UPI001C050C26|nr:ABC transporter permease subunit [Pimelobacter sp. 30-1]MBU2694870.1 ABC transporter permease [Pimelobacter sp. 30-1]
MTAVLGIDTRLGDLQPEFWQAAGETLVMATTALVLGGLLGLALGLGLFVTRKGGLYANRLVFVVLNVAVNFFRPIPFVIFVAALQPVARQVVGTGIGIWAATFAITIAAIFGVSRIVEQNLVTVSPGVIEAARAMGASRLRIALTVVLPEALGPMILGFTFAFVAIVDMTAIAGVVAGGGLGSFAQRFGFRQFDQVITWSAIVVLVAMVTVIQLGGNVLARRVLRR